MNDLIKLQSKVRSLLQFRVMDDEDSGMSTLAKTGIGAAGLGAAGVAGYGGLTALRGAKQMQGQYGGKLMPDNLGQAKTAFNLGHAANMRSAGRFTEVLAEKLAKAKSAIGGFRLGAKASEDTVRLSVKIRALATV